MMGKLNTVKGQGFKRLKRHCIEELHLHQIELTMAEDRTFDTVYVNPEDLK